MPQEPYNLFANAGSTLPGGSAYEDLLVVLKAVVKQNGGTMEINEHLLMYVDRDEAIRVDDVWKDGSNHKVFSIETKQRNQNPEGHIAHGGADPEDPSIQEFTFSYQVGRGCGMMIALVVLLSFLYLVGQVVRAVLF